MSWQEHQRTCRKSTINRKEINLQNGGHRRQLSKISHKSHRSNLSINWYEQENNQEDFFARNILNLQLTEKRGSHQNNQTKRSCSNYENQQLLEKTPIKHAAKLFENHNHHLPVLNTQDKVNMNSQMTENI